MLPSAPLESALASWVRSVVESLPVAVASPVWIEAVPSELLDALPELELTPPPEPDPVLDATVGAPPPPPPLPPVLWDVSAEFPELLPTAMLPPVFADALPWLTTEAFWSTTWIEPWLPETVTVCSVFELPDVPVALAPPVRMVPLPSEPFVAAAVLSDVVVGVARVCRGGAEHCQQRATGEREDDVTNETPARLGLGRRVVVDGRHWVLLEGRDDWRLPAGARTKQEIPLRARTHRRSIPIGVRTNAYRVDGG